MTAAAPIDKGAIHFVIGDTQVKPGVPLDHLAWIGQYLVDQFAGQRRLRVIHVGDHWDMPSLSSYDKGKKAIEGRRYTADIKAGNKGMDLLCTPLAKYNAGRRKTAQWWPRKDFFLGNHEARIARACEEDAQLDGVLSYDDFNLVKWGWTVHPFLKPAVIGGISYAHYFYNPHTGRPYSGDNLLPRLKTIGRSFTMGHQQGLNVATRHVGNRRHQGLVLGSTYLHDEDYLGPQGNAYWRGIMICHQVEKGQYDRMEVSLEWLCRKYEGVTLAEFTGAASAQEKVAA